MYIYTCLPLLDETIIKSVPTDCKSTLSLSIISVGLSLLRPSTIIISSLSGESAF